MGQNMNQNPPAKPWVITSCTDNGPGYWYRYSVDGVNHYRSPPERFSWSLHDLDDARYDLSAVTPHRVTDNSCDETAVYASKADARGVVADLLRAYRADGAAMMTLERGRRWACAIGEGFGPDITLSPAPDADPSEVIA